MHSKEFITVFRTNIPGLSSDIQIAQDRIPQVFDFPSLNYKTISTEHYYLAIVQKI